MYDRGYQTWAALWQIAAAHNNIQCQLSSLFSVFSNHPYFPERLTVDKSFSNTATVRGTTTWTTSRGPCDLSSFREEMVLHVASNCPTTIVFSSSPHSKTSFLNQIARESNQVPILVLAWAYILSARWAELIPGAAMSDYNSLQEARMGWWKVDFGAAAWTGTHASFIQEPVTKASPDAQEIS